MLCHLCTSKLTLDTLSSSEFTTGISKMIAHQMILRHNWGLVAKKKIRICWEFYETMRMRGLGTKDIETMLLMSWSATDWEFTVKFKTPGMQSKHVDIELCRRHPSTTFKMLHFKGSEKQVQFQPCSQDLWSCQSGVGRWRTLGMRLVQFRFAVVVTVLVVCCCFLFLLWKEASLEFYAILGTVCMLGLKKR